MQTLVGAWGLSFPALNKRGGVLEPALLQTFIFGLAIAPLALTVAT